MKIYLDTGNIEEIKEVAELGLLDGVTTNPTLIAKEGKEFKTVIYEIVEILKKNCRDEFTVSAEVTNLESAESMVDEARELVKIDEHLLIKVPLTSQGLKAVNILSKENIRCNVTLCFSANQALLAAKAGAWCVSPFLGRLDDIGEDGAHLIHEIRTIFDKFNMDTNILSASIRSENHVKNCAIIGSDIITMPYKVYMNMYEHSLTNKGLDSFEKDWKEYKQKLKNE